MTPEQAAALRAPFPPSAIGKIPKGGTQLDYVGHAAVTDRLLEVDPAWGWLPVAIDEHGLPIIHTRGNDSVMWITLTVCGVSRFGVGIVASKSFELEKQLISDAIRNAAMRFGVALDLWSKEDLHSPAGNESTPAARPESSSPIEAPGVSKARREKLKSRCVALQADGISVADEREALRLPLVDSCNEAQFILFEQLVTDLEAKLAAPFAKAEA